MQIAITSVEHLVSVLAAFPEAEIHGEGLVRDAVGKPRIDGDPRELPASVRAALTAPEFETACLEFDHG